MTQDLSKTETVACAAIMLSNGLMIAGKRHHNCLAQLKIVGHTSRNAVEQGFMTTGGRFVNREEAQKIQRAAGIESADPGGYRGSELCSEDLY